MIELYSDTMTKPTAAMRRAMAEAEVADEQQREDPTTNRLQDRVAQLLGKEAAVLLPTGTMCNAIAVKTHTQPSDALVCESMAHVSRAEFGGAALLSGVTTEPIDTSQGTFTPEQLISALSHFHAYGPVPSLVCVEQTHNFGGGTVWPLQQLRSVCDAAHERKLLTHMDGARLFNACVASGVSARDYCQSFDSVWIDLSKGLGCPLGAVLAGSKEFIARAWRFKHLFGGAMRQSGIIAAAGLHALDHHIDRLRDDHDNARLLASGLASIEGIELITPQPQTNIVFFDIARTSRSPADFHAESRAAGVRFSGGGTRVRAVTHLDVSRADVEQAIDIVQRVVGWG